MGASFFISPYFFWALLAAVNFVIQIAYYFHGNKRLFIAKKATTPLLLFSGMLIVIVNSRSFAPVPCAVLAAMGLGEIGIEGSSVVEKHEGEKPGVGSSVIVLISGILFLLVNIFIGTVLLIRSSAARLPVSAGFAVIIILLMLAVSIRTFRPDAGLRTQMFLYSAGLVVLLSGVLSDAAGGLSALGLAGAVLTLSDSLVLIRMGAGLDRQNRKGFIVLFTFLVVILLLYYFYMWIMITKV